MGHQMIGRFGAGVLGAAKAVSTARLLQRRRGVFACPRAAARRRSAGGLASGKGPAGVLATVPFVRADGGEEMLHRCFVAAQQLAVEVTRIPVDQNAAEIKHDSITGRLHHQ